MDQDCNPDEMKWMILNSTEPLLMKNTMKWLLLDWTLDDWNKNIGQETMTFRLGLYKRTKEPQWERTTKSFEESFQYFLDSGQNNRSQWFYFDYKYLNNCFNNAHNLRKEIRWDLLGFPDIKPEDCTIWIGSKGAHTPCHIDSYGCNLVYQIYGTKLWLLFPPEEDLKASRIPYEESSVYSKLNFFSPNMNDFKGIADKCRKVILHPGEVLMVPNKWWHYVENLETSISINVWLPLPRDDEERLREAIVQFFVKQMIDLSDADTRKHILNPNMEEIIAQNSSVFLQTIDSCKTICKRDELPSNKKLKSESDSTVTLSDFKLTDIMHKHKNIEVLPRLSKEEFDLFLKEQNERFESTIFDEKTVINHLLDNNTISMVNALTNPEVVELITNKLIFE